MSGLARVLVIEDDDDLRDTVVRYLRGVGMSVTGLESAEQLDAELARQQFDVAVCDVNLPGEDGFSVLARLRARSAMRVVMLTARGMLNDRLHALGLGADYYLIKPVNLRELEMVLHNLVQRRQEAPAPVTRAPAAAAAEQGDAPAQGPWRYHLTTWLLLSPDGQQVQLSNAGRGCCNA
ncbi:response regulator [uncultured Variovorax sp.]|uniref:response regulator transcription factor n=1 Tax=uncultured Variovorax sp. TaxID=114708 RepID=UPI0025EA5047|nr:response regulator [uncultured Variovorax sp.]